MSRLIYEERQRFALWAYAALIGAIGSALLFGVPELYSDPAHSLLWTLLTAGGMLALLCGVFNLLWLVVRVHEDHIYVRLGWAFPMLWTRLPLDDVEAVQVVTYRPLLQAGGWGWRFGHFNGRWCRFYNARGNRGVWLQINGKQYIIGSQEPERLAGVLIELCELNVTTTDTFLGASDNPYRRETGESGPATRPV